MNKLYNALFVMIFAILFSVSACGAGNEPDLSSTNQQRELIYCADYMTHEEREAYRTSMREARTQQEKTAARQEHQETMQARVRERGIDPVECEPQRVRERLRLRQREGKS